MAELALGSTAIMHRDGDSRPSVGIIGGGLAGLATAVVLADKGLHVEVFEARRMLGGRAASYRDPDTGEAIDNCQHVSMRCCTNLADFCKRTGLQPLLRRDRVLHFFSREGRRHDLAASRWLPAPLHLGPALMRLSYLSWRDRIAIARAMWALMRERVTPDDGQTIGTWLRACGQSDQAIECFWSVVLVSALSETVDRASLVAARQVFVDGFLRTQDGYEIEVPTVGLSELYGSRLQFWLEDRGVALRTGAAVKQVETGRGSQFVLWFADGTTREFEFVIAAVPWRRLVDLLGKSLECQLPLAIAAEQIESAPITGIHLWFDRPITPLPHAVLVGRTSQWLFNRNDFGDASLSQKESRDAEHYYQVVISASRQLASRQRENVIQEVLDDLKAVFPDARDATVLRWRMVTEQHAVFSVQPGLGARRPQQRTSVPNFFLAGDWTQTGWPATMEGAIRSGYLAAEGVLEQLGRPQKMLVSDLKSGRLARLLIR